MTARDWKPGDVVVIDADYSHFHGMRGLIVADGVGWSVVLPEHGKDPVAFGASALRTLVVIDPEDREQVERFTHAFLSHYWSDDYSAHSDAGQAALREFANPTPPKCSASLIVRGEHFGCDSANGHDLPHGSSAAEAIWGGES